MLADKLSGVVERIVECDIGFSLQCNIWFKSCKGHRNHVVDLVIDKALSCAVSTNLTDSSPDRIVGKTELFR